MTQGILGTVAPGKSPQLAQQAFLSSSQVGTVYLLLTHLIHHPRVGGAKANRERPMKALELLGEVLDPTLCIAAALLCILLAIEAITLAYGG
jgi:hypothetical protein